MSRWSVCCTDVIATSEHYSCDVTRPAEAMFHHHGLNTNTVGLLHGGDVCGVVVPFNTEDAAEILSVELLELLQVLLVLCRGLATVEHSGNDNRSVDHEFGGSAEVVVLEDRFKSNVCSSDSVINVFVYGECQNASEVGSTNGDIAD